MNEPHDRLSDERSCPYCAEPIRLAAVVCKHCGMDIKTGRSTRMAGTQARGLTITDGVHVGIGFLVLGFTGLVFVYWLIVRLLR